MHHRHAKAKQCISVRLTGGVGLLLLLMRLNQPLFLALYSKKSKKSTNVAWRSYALHSALPDESTRSLGSTRASGSKRRACAHLRQLKLAQSSLLNVAACESLHTAPSEPRDPHWRTAAASARAESEKEKHLIELAVSFKGTKILASRLRIHLTLAPARLGQHRPHLRRQIDADVPRLETVAHLASY